VPCADPRRAVSDVLPPPLLREVIAVVSSRSSVGVSGRREEGTRGEGEEAVMPDRAMSAGTSSGVSKHVEGKGGEEEAGRVMDGSVQGQLESEGNEANESVAGENRIAVPSVAHVLIAVTVR